MVIVNTQKTANKNSISKIPFNYVAWVLRGWRLEELIFNWREKDLPIQMSLLHTYRPYKVELCGDEPFFIVYLDNGETVKFMKATGKSMFGSYLLELKSYETSSV